MTSKLAAVVAAVTVSAQGANVANPLAAAGFSDRAAWVGAAVEPPEETTKPAQRDTPPKSTAITDEPAKLRNDEIAFEISGGKMILNGSQEGAKTLKPNEWTELTVDGKKIEVNLALDRIKGPPLAGWFRIGLYTKTGEVLFEGQIPSDKEMKQKSFQISKECPRAWNEQPLASTELQIFKQGDKSWVLKNLDGKVCIREGEQVELAFGGRAVQFELQRIDMSNGQMATITKNELILSAKGIGYIATCQTVDPSGRVFDPRPAGIVDLDPKKRKK